MNFSILKLLIATTAIAICLAFSIVLFGVLTAAGDDQHYFGVGTEFTVDSFELTNANRAFALSPTELAQLDKEWGKGRFEQISAIAAKINANGKVCEFRATLSDGFRIKSESKYCSIDETDYLQLELVTDDAGGFQADFNFLRVNLSQIFSPDRLQEFRRFIAD